MLKELRLINWRSFRDATLYIDPLTIIIGMNASGKSNVLDALLFLQRLAAGTSMILGTLLTNVTNSTIESFEAFKHPRNGGNFCDEMPYCFGHGGAKMFHQFFPMRLRTYLSFTMSRISNPEPSNDAGSPENLTWSV